MKPDIEGSYQAVGIGVAWRKGRETAIRQGSDFEAAWHGVRLRSLCRRQPRDYFTAVDKS